MASGHGELQKTNMSSVEEASHSGGPPETGATEPLLSPGPRPAAASSNGSVGPHEGQIKNFAGHIVSAQGNSREGQVPESTGCSSASQQFCNLYMMSPALLVLFKSLGAENRPYTFQEVWRFLYTYLFKNRYLFDKTDDSFVNCDGDPVGAAFGVKRFHVNDVRYLLGKNVHRIGVVPLVAGGITRSASHNGFTTSSSQSNGYHRPFLGRSLSCHSSSSTGESRDSCGSSAEVAGSAHKSPFSWRATSSDGAATSMQSVSADPTQSRQGMAVKDSNGLVLGIDSAGGKNNQSDTNGLEGVSSSSGVSVDRRSETDVSGFDDKPGKKTDDVYIVLDEDDTPVSISDAETEHSCQGYETALCRNTESEGDESGDQAGDLFDEMDFEEYEIAPDDVSEQPLSDDDSELEDVELAVVTLMYEDEEDEVCWGDDDSDSESTSASDTDTDPDLAQEKWACLKCNKKNKAFMRYCEKCWQQRKNWLPDCPKGKKRRKPRPKKPKKSRIPQNGLKATTPLESISRWDSAVRSQECEYIDAESSSKSQECKYIDIEGSSKNRECKYIDAESSSRSEVTSAEVEKSKRRLSGSLSDASTVSIDEVLMASGSCRSQDATCSQDSGIGMSQESFSGVAQSTSASGVSEKCSEVKMEIRDDSKSKSAREESILIELDGILCEDSSDISAKSKIREENAMPSTSYATPSTSYVKHNRGTGVLKTESEPAHRTLKRKHSEEVFVATCIKRPRSTGTKAEEESLSESDEVDPKDLAQSLVQLLQSKIEFLQSAKGQKWISTTEGKRCASHTLEAEQCDFLSVGIADISAHKLCSLCFMRPKNAIVVHGRRSHQFSCYPCAKRLMSSKSRCPICRRKIHMVTQNVLV